MNNSSTHLRTAEVLIRIWKSWNTRAHFLVKILASKPPLTLSVMKEMFSVPSSTVATSHTLGRST